MRLSAIALLASVALAACKPPEGPKVAIVVAARDLPAGSAITEDAVQALDLPVAQVTGNMVTPLQVETVKGRLLIIGLAKGDPLLATALAPAKK